MLRVSCLILWDMAITLPGTWMTEVTMRKVQKVTVSCSILWDTVVNLPGPSDD